MSAQDDERYYDEFWGAAADTPGAAEIGLWDENQSADRGGWDSSDDYAPIDVTSDAGTQVEESFVGKLNQTMQSVASGVRGAYSTLTGAVSGMLGTQQAQTEQEKGASAKATTYTIPSSYLPRSQAEAKNPESNYNVIKSVMGGGVREQAEKAYARSRGY